MQSENSFNLIMISAMYENGGNTTHRLMDGHPELFVYPFESQLGTSNSVSFLQSLVPFRYCWPEFPLNNEPANDYELFYDEELKTRLRVPERSKFKHAALVMNEAERRNIFCNIISKNGRSRTNLIEAFFVSTFESWKNYKRSNKETAYVGYSPVIALDTEKIFSDFPNAQVIHVVRNPYSGFADTKKRPYPLSLKRYIWTWNIMQHIALTYAQIYSNNFHIIRFEDIISNTEHHMKILCHKLNISYEKTLLYPSWNGEKLSTVYPWGTIKAPTPESNMATMNELSAQEKAEIKTSSFIMLKQLGYDNLI